MSRLLKFFFLVPALTLLWGVANTTGATQQFTTMTGVNIPSGWQIPGLAQVLSVNDKVQGAKDQVRTKAQREATKALRKQVRARYGPETAALVPNTLNVRAARRILTAVASGASLPDVRAMLKGAIPPGASLPDKPGNGGGQGGGSGSGGGGGGGGAQPGVVNIPFMTSKDYAEARKRLPALTVKGKGPMTGYSRAQYGSEWDDDAGNFPWTGNGCDTREDVLKRDLTKVAYESGSKCDVISGVVPYERYTGKKNVAFDSEDGEYATDLDIEHVVALGNVWVSGGAGWSESKRSSVANDPMNLFAADPSSNRQKGDADAATWLPSNKAFRCAYISQQVAVKTKYAMSVTPAEKQAMSGILSSCS